MSQPAIKVLWFTPPEYSSKPAEINLIAYLQSELPLLDIIPIGSNDANWQDKWSEADIDLIITHVDSQHFVAITDLVKSWKVPRVTFMSQPNDLVFTNCDQVCQKCVYFTRQDLSLPNGIYFVKNYYDAVFCFDKSSAHQIFYEMLSVPTIIDPNDLVKFKTIFEDMAHSLCMKDENAIRIGWIGEHLFYHSLARINRELILRFLADKNHNWLVRVSIGLHRLNFDLCEKYPELTWRAQSVRFNGPIDYFISHIWPPPFDYMPIEGKWIVIQPWEFGPVPTHWINPIQRHVDELWEPSTYVKEGFVESGIHPSMIQVIPNGVDPAVYRPKTSTFQLETKKTFKFLFVGGSIHRKGYDVLLKAYIKEFSSEDDVVLIMKDFGLKSFYKNAAHADIIQGVLGHKECPEILYLTDDLTDEDMAELYSASDCYVHPYRGEGFGMPIAEAMACGLPVIVTDYGACLDFCNEENAYLIPATMKMESSDYIPDYELTGNLRVAEPDENVLRELMRHVYEQPEEAKIKGKKASELIRTNYSWDDMFQKASERLIKLYGEQPKRQNNTHEMLRAHYIQSVQIEDWPMAKAYLSKLSEFLPEDASLYYQLAVLDIKLTQYLEAIQHLKLALRYQYNSQNIVRQVKDIISNLSLDYQMLDSLLKPVYIIWDFPKQFWVPPLKFLNHKSVYIKDKSQAPEDSFIIYISDGKSLPPDGVNSVALMTYPYPENLDAFQSFQQVWGSQEQLYSDEKYRAIPLGIDTKRFSYESEAAEIEGMKEQNILAVFDWATHHWMDFISAYLKSFNSESDCALLLKFYTCESIDQDLIIEKLMEFLSSQNHVPEEELPDIVLIEQDINNENLPSILKSAVALMVDEGYNSEYLMGAAKSQGLPVISWSEEQQIFVEKTHSIFNWVKSQGEIEAVLRTLNKGLNKNSDSVNYSHQQSQTSRSQEAFKVLIGQYISHSLRELEDIIVSNE